MGNLSLYAVLMRFWLPTITVTISISMWPPRCSGTAVNYLIRTPGGSLYHGDDSHFSNYYAIDVCLGSYGENPRGITDKMTSVDILRMAECLKARVVIPVHHDLWTNFQADTREIISLWRMKKDRLKYTFKPFVRQVVGSTCYSYPGRGRSNPHFLSSLTFFPFPSPGRSKRPGRACAGNVCGSGRL